MISQFKFSELGCGDPVSNAKLFNVGSAPNTNMLLILIRISDLDSIQDDLEREATVGIIHNCSFLLFLLV
jgi:hypothetical protein